LSILADSESYGYAIVTRVGELSDGTLQWTEGMLYPLLHRLERQGYVEGRWGTSESGRKRKYYRITESGLAHLARQRRQWQAVDEALRTVWSALSGTPRPRGLITSEGG
jgi:DNA-binding PadR family transcriptional regulator